MAAEIDPSELADATTAFLDDRSDGERVITAVLEVDSASSTWTFDDVPLDSGTFGELVSRGIVESADDGYRVADPAVVSAVLEGEPIEPETDGDDSVGISSIELGIWGDRRGLVGLAAALVLVVVMRMTQYRSVVRDDRLVSPGNDPYFYRYWTEQMLAESPSPTDIGLLAELPPAVAETRPLTHVLNWWLATLLGGDQWAADLIATWLPIGGAVVLGVVVYGLAVLLTRDVRVGIVSVIFLAIAPIHVVYTQVGFLEHRLYQYVWLGVTLVALAWLAVDLTNRLDRTGGRQAVRDHLASKLTWLASGVLGLALGVSIQLWGGSPLLFVPLAGYMALRSAIDVRESISPTLANLPVVVALGVGAVLSAGVHVGWGWQPAFVAYTPAMVLVGAVAVCGLGDLWRRTDLYIGGLVASQVAIAATGLTVFRLVRPQEWEAAQARAGELFFRTGATETTSLFALEHAVIFGPLAQLGVSFYLGVAVLVWAIWTVSRQYEPAWLLLVVYAAVFMLFAGLQLRFAAQFMIPLSVLAGVGFVYLLSAIDLVRRPVPFRSADGSRDTLSVTVPDRQKTIYIIGVGLLVCGLSFVYVPTLTGETTYDDEQLQAVAAIEDHETPTDREYPENFVLSEWPENRMYNYFVNEEANSYDYARLNFDEFRSHTNPDRQYEEVGHRVGYVVVTDVGEAPPDTTQEQLLGELGGGTETHDPLEHYQLLAVDDERSTATFALVSGATLSGSGGPGDRISISTNVSVDSESFSYDREVVVDQYGAFELTVPYPGEYTVGETTITVTETDVEQGATIDTTEQESGSS